MRSTVLALVIGLVFTGLGSSAQADSELCLEGPTTITINHLLGDVPPAATELIVSNCGDAADTLNWSSSFSGTAAPFMDANPISGVIVGGQGMDDIDPMHEGTSASSTHPTHGQQRVLVTLNQDGLVTSGSYSGQLTFQNDDNPTNSVVINLELNITSVNFTPGDTLIGSIDPASDSDAAAFFGIKGLTLKLKIKQSTEVSRLRITLLDPSAAPIKSIEVKTNKTRHKKFKLDEDGLFLMRIESADGSTGTYEIATNRGLPSSASPRSYNRLKPKRENPGDSTASVTVKIAALPGALMNANCIPKAPLDVSEISLALKTPSGQLFDTSDFDAESDTAIHLVRVPLAEVGNFKLIITVDGPQAGDRVRVPVWPFQPKGTSVIDLDE